MKAEDQHMDDIFRKAAQEQQFPYKADLWNDVESQLNDDFLDIAFKSAAGNSILMPDMNFGEAMDDAFLDDAFKSAAENAAIDYPANAWSSFLSEAPAIEQDIAFHTAANAVTADYHPAFWSDADQALQNEGLHYEYKSAYWNEAKHLLDHADRNVFFFRWSAVAALLLLFSFGGLYQSFNNERGLTPMASDHKQTAEQLTSLAENEVTSERNSTQVATDESFFIQNNQNSEYHSENNQLPVENNEAINTQNTQSANPLATIALSETNLSQQVQNNEFLIDEDLTVAQETVSNEPLSLSNPLEINLNENSMQTIQLTNLNHTSLQNSETDLTANVIALPGNQINMLEPSLLNGNPGPLVEVQRHKLKATHSLSFVANAGIGNKYGEAAFTPSYRTSFGIEYNRSGFGRLRNFEFGGSMTMNHVRQNGFGTERHVNVFNVRGGVDKLWYKLQYKDMIYANVSGIATYQLSKRNSIHLSFGMDYLVFVQSNLSYQVDADAEITTVNNNWGIKDGLTKVDARLGLGYEFSVTSRFAVQLNGSFGFRDRSNDEFISKNFLDHEMNATVGLKYTFLRKL